jgi:hypothetical protein
MPEVPMPQGFRGTTGDGLRSPHDRQCRSFKQRVFCQRDEDGIAEAKERLSGEW